MGRISQIDEALEGRFFPHLEFIGFVRDERRHPRQICFRRRTDSVMHLLSVLWEPRGRPFFALTFSESPLTGVDCHGDHISAEDVLPGNIVLTHGTLQTAPGDLWFRLDRPLWRRLVAMQRNDDPDQVVDLLMELFPEVVAWWESKTVGPHLALYPAIPLPDNRKLFGGATTDKAARPLLKIHYFLAHGRECAASGGAVTLAVLVGLGCGVFSLRTVLAMILALPLGFILGGIFLLPLISAIVSKINGSPFHEGDLVRVLVGPHRDLVAYVYDVWTQRGQVRVDLGKAAEKAVTDVFNFMEVKREEEAEPNASPNDGPATPVDSSQATEGPSSVS